jgi:hypothetical protein
VNGELTRWFGINSSTGQSAVHGPPIFNLAINWALELTERFKRLSKGLILQKRQSSRCPEKCVMDLDYADDIAALDNTAKGLEETTDNFAKYCAFGGLKMDARKTETVIIGKGITQHPLLKDITVNVTGIGTP